MARNVAFLQSLIIRTILERVHGTRDGPERDCEPSGTTPRGATGESTPLAHALAATGDRWTLAIALELAPGRTRLAKLRQRLPGVSTGVLDRHLGHMVALGLVTRRRYREMPPRVELELTEPGHELVPIAHALARWGMRHLWSEPNAGEQIDVGALLRMLPVLLGDLMDTPDGSIEAVLDESSRPTRHLFGIERGRLVLRGEDAPTETNVSEPPGARLRGNREAWIAALGPEADVGQLEITGDTGLATRIVAALPRSAGAAKPG
jgi:DNA-binding HxlR family transcriptional regulator